ncbi:MAG: glycosyltransferase family 4 protein [Syntrophales bacterium]
MRILFLTQWFQPEPLFKGLPFARALADRGHDVEVFTGFPNYPGGNVYRGYRVRLFQRETMDGIRVNRVALYPSHNKSAFRRILNYLSFALSSFLLASWIIRRPDVIYVYNLVTLGPAAFLLRLIFRSKVIVDVTDLWPESVMNSGMVRNRQMIDFLNKFCDQVYQSADRLIVVSPGVKKVLIARGVTPENIDVIYNWCDENSMKIYDDESDSPALYGLTDKFNIIFAGTMGTVQALDSVLACAAICQNGLPDIQFIFVGGGVDRDRLKKKAEGMGLMNVTFLPPQPIEAMGPIFAMADALLVHLKDDPLFRITIPSKTQAYLYTGKPIIMAMRGDAADLVREAGAGVLCAPEDPQEMMNAIKTLYQMPEIERRKMGEAGHRYYMGHLSFNQGVNQFEQIMMSLSREAS